MRRSALPGLLLLSLAVGASAAPLRADPAPGDPRDRLFAERAARVGRSVSTRHLTPEGLLAYRHRREAAPEHLSADALLNDDTAIWSGCYAAAAACRHFVVRDAASLGEAKRVAAGLDLLSRATGVPGALSRSVGRPLPGQRLDARCRPSPLGGGLWYRGDPSRDSLSGVVLGWACLARFVDDAEVRATAASHLGAIARRLHRGGMRLRDVDGRVTTYGDLDAHVFLGLVPNGMHAAIGLAAVAAGAARDRGEDLQRAVRSLDRDGWTDAVAAQHADLDIGGLVKSSNVNMVHLALLTLSLEGTEKARRRAHEALGDLRRRTRGWQNGSYLACYLLAGKQVDRAGVVAELRSALADLPAQEVPWAGARKERGRRVVPLSRRPVTTWSWKEGPYEEEVGREVAVPDPALTYTRADYLFAYWLARAAGELDPDRAR